MAYLREINQKCSGYGCKSQAKVELIDRWNGNRGQYCRKCAKAALKRQKANEAPDE